jgi:hypothetical protein
MSMRYRLGNDARHNFLSVGTMIIVLFTKNDHIAYTKAYTPINQIAMQHTSLVL